MRSLCQIHCSSPRLRVRVRIKEEPEMEERAKCDGSFAPLLLTRECDGREMTGVLVHSPIFRARWCSLNCRT